MAWRLRAAGAGDADALSLVATATFLETYAGILDGADIVAHCRDRLTAAAFTALIADPMTRVTLAGHDIGGAPVGYMVVTPSRLPIARDGDTELRRLYALASFHGGGLGPALMARAVAEARADGGARLLLGVYHGNARARRFYERSGFTIVGERPFRVGAAVYRDPVYALTL
ncbi:GNAT family N-acetyltransferase [Sphingomonas bacterium]|uniref:GNAT family N-acetyltransferase n=1 Tax=Sphingomonas bacterium TaxID=1895847 RepID=UPI0015771C7D|nr:GNAT family N-acetyltransferase [Sphingomonas bacterium]